jgi:hypothetical protein
MKKDTPKMKKYLRFNRESKTKQEYQSNDNNGIRKKQTYDQNREKYKKTKKSIEENKASEKRSILERNRSFQSK